VHNNDLDLYHFFQFINTADAGTVVIQNFDFKLLQGDSSSGLDGPSTGMVNMSKVREYLHSMGDNLAPQAVQMMDSVEQFQKVKLTVLPCVLCVACTLCVFIEQCLTTQLLLDSAQSIVVF